MQNDEKSLQNEATGMISTDYTEKTFNDYGFVITAVAGFMVVGSAFYIVIKKKTVDDAFNFV